GRELSREPEDLHADGGEPCVQLRDVYLRHRAFLGGHDALIDEPRVQEAELAADLDAHLEIRDRATHPGNRAERTAVAHRAADERLQVLEEAMEEPRRAERHALELERHHDVVEDGAALHATV